MKHNYYHITDDLFLPAHSWLVVTPLKGHRSFFYKESSSKVESNSSSSSKDTLYKENTSSQNRGLEMQIMVTSIFQAGAVCSLISMGIEGPIYGWEWS